MHPAPLHRARVRGPVLLPLALLGLLGCRSNSLPSWANPEGGTPIFTGDAAGAEDAAADGSDDGSTDGRRDAGWDAGRDAGADAGGDAGHDAGRGDADAGDAAKVQLPPSGQGFDYQIGGAYPPAANVAIVSRDRQASPAPGLYNICYVNGFQVQPQEESFWMSQHPQLLLRDDDGNPVIDADWDEMLLDVGSEAKRAALADVVGGWIAGCARDGFDAVEVDNLDTYTRSGGRLSAADAVAFIRLLAGRAHAEGLAIAQKNAAELVDQRATMATDFVVAEECNAWDECDVYTAAYGQHVLVVEYEREDFEAGCQAFPELSIVLRDLDVSPEGSAGHVYDGC